MMKISIAAPVFIGMLWAKKQNSLGLGSVAVTLPLPACSPSMSERLANNAWQLFGRSQSFRMCAVSLKNLQMRSDLV